MDANTYSGNDPRIRIEGAVSLQYCDGPESENNISRLYDRNLSLGSDKKRVKIIPWRIPFTDAALYPDDSFRREAITAAGVRLMVNTDATEITMHGFYFSIPSKECPVYLMDLCRNNRIITTAELIEGKVEFKNLSPGKKELEIWLSPGFDYVFGGIELNRGASLLPLSEDKRPRWITYGSSITHSIRAKSPALTWPAIVARENNWDLLSLGYGGQCMMDSMIARCIRDTQADIISMEIGANLYNGNMSQRTFQAAVIGSVAIIREKHPDISLILCSLIYAKPWETKPGPTGLTAQMMRKDIKNIVEIFKSRGDSNIYYFDGLDLLGPDLVYLQPDNIHPDAEGNIKLAENFQKMLVANRMDSLKL